MAYQELIKGMIKPLILKLLEENHRMYGYEITRQVEELSGGRIRLTFGALYPVLHKLEKSGIVETETELANNRTRVYYKLTRSGQQTAKDKIHELEDFIRVLGEILLAKPGMSHGKAESFAG
ncbi:MAG TPA: PadR family transcriptional regulator [Bacteroidales bacterium]|nr:PadR family transcriptional regulator [Bacteroidales bacterium]HSA44881.1 PadR family transcriptional regulator [Bacteroidales bacterium]